MTDDCGCCVTAAAPVPAEIENRPGLSTVAYRIGTFATFRKAILDRLSSTKELRDLSARVDNDYTITLVDLWCAVADVLTFYQERTANEAFLRTAVLRDSVLRLVRLIGYELAPGVGATTQLAFTLERNSKALIPARTRVQSVPEAGRAPQKYETLADLAADSRFNALRIFPHPQGSDDITTSDPPSPTAPGAADAIVAPDPAALANAASLVPGDRVLIYGPLAAEVLVVREVRISGDLLMVAWVSPIASSELVAAYDGKTDGAAAYRLGRTFRLFGFDAPSKVGIAKVTTGDPGSVTVDQDETDFDTLTTGTDHISLDARYDGLKPNGRLLIVARKVTEAGPTICAVPVKVTSVWQESAELDSKNTAALVQSGVVTKVAFPRLPSSASFDEIDIRNVTVYELIGNPLSFWPYSFPETITSSEVYLPGWRAGWSSVEVGCTIEKGIVRRGTTIDLSDLAAKRPVLLTDDGGSEPMAAVIAGSSLVGTDIAFLPTVQDLLTVRKLGLAAEQTQSITMVVSSPLALSTKPSNKRYEMNVKIGSLPTQTIALDPNSVVNGVVSGIAGALQEALRAAIPTAPAFSRAVVREIFNNDALYIVVAAGVPGEEVAFTGSPNDFTTVVELGLDRERRSLIDGVLSAPFASSTSIAGQVRVRIGFNAPRVKSITVPALAKVDKLIEGIETIDGVHAIAYADDRIIVVPPLGRGDRRVLLRLALDIDEALLLDTSSAVLLGNVAPASHGETIRNEIVGDGDASKAFQRFTLKKKPLTYVPSATPGGVESSLELSVNGVRWQQKASLYGSSSKDQNFVTRIADDGTTTVQFGDGVSGARLPTGRQNVVARYRQGIGVEGRVAAAKLTNLLDRPTGVKGVTNPIAADGGADPESMDRARAVAPGTVRTFGRAVSLRDFEDTALLAGEVAKVSANWVWTGKRRAIHLTVAGREGGAFSAQGLARLAATLATERDPNYRLLVDNYVPVAVRVDASLIVDDRYVATQVLSAARDALLDAFSFEHRRFAEPVYSSDVVAVLQGVEGVVAVDLNELDLKSSDPSLRAAHGVDDTLGQPQPRLLMLPARPAEVFGKIAPAELAQVETPADDIVLAASGGIV